MKQLLEVGGGLFWLQVELQVRASGLSCEGQEGKCELCCFAVSSCGGAGLQQLPPAVSLLLRNHQTHRIHKSSCSCYSKEPKNKDVMMLWSVLVEAPACSCCLLQSLLLNNHQTPRICNSSSFCSYAAEPKIQMLWCLRGSGLHQ